MSVDIIKKIKNDNWLVVFAIFSCAALCPEYIAPVLTALGAFFTIKNTKIKKLQFNDFSVGYAYLLFFGWLIIGSFYAESIISPLATLGLWALMFSGFWMCTVWIDSADKLDKVLYGGTIAAGINGGIGLAQALLRAVIGDKPATIFNPLWHFLDLLVEKLVLILPDSLAAQLPRKTFKLFPDRSSGTMSNPLFFATFLVCMLSVCFYCFLNGKSYKIRRNSFFCLLLTLGGIATSMSRGPYIVTVAIFAMTLIYGGIRAKKVLFVGLTGGAAVVILFNKVIARLLTLGSDSDRSINTRKKILDAVFEKIPDEFLFGYGTGFDSVRSILHNEYKIKQPHAHNIILEFQMENGIIGVLLFLLVCAVFAFNMYRLYKKGGSARNFGITFFGSFIAMCMCGMTDCIFYGFKPLQYFMMIMGLGQAAVNIFLKGDDFFTDLRYFIDDIKAKINSLKNRNSEEIIEEQEETEDIRV